LLLVAAVQIASDSCAGCAAYPGTDHGAFRASHFLTDRRAGATTDCPADNSACAPLARRRSRGTHCAASCASDYRARFTAEHVSDRRAPRTADSTAHGSLGCAITCPGRRYGQRKGYSHHRLSRFAEHGSPPSQQGNL
jgi:hypothetical protein